MVREVASNAEAGISGSGLVQGWPERHSALVVDPSRVHVEKDFVRLGRANGQGMRWSCRLWQDEGGLMNPKH